MIVITTEGFEETKKALAHIPGAGERERRFNVRISHAKSRVGSSPGLDSCRWKAPSFLH